MTWYGVHVVMVVEFKDGNQSTYPAWDNVYLIDAHDDDEAARKATAIGKTHEGDSDGTFLWDDRPATWTCKGVRKIVTLSNSDSETDVPGDGAEVTYQTLEFDDHPALERFLQGSPTRLVIVD